MFLFRLIVPHPYLRPLNVVHELNVFFLLLLFVLLLSAFATVAL